MTGANGADQPPISPHTSGWKIVYGMAALLIFVPLLFASGRLRRRSDKYACSPEIFYSHAERHFHSGHYADSHQPFRQSVANAADSADAR
jgi:hypothetical protein